MGFIGFGLWPLLLVSLPIAIIAARPLRGRALGVGALFFGAVALSGGFHWAIHLLVTFAYLPWPLAVLGFLLLIGYEGLVLASVLGGVVVAERRLGVQPIWSAMVLWPCMEHVFPHLFPHYAGAALWRLSPIMQVVEISGPLGLTALVAAVSGGLVSLWDAAQARRVAVALAPVTVALVLVIGAWTYGAARIPAIDYDVSSAPTLKVGLIQSNIGARELRGRRVPLVRRHQRMTADLVKAVPDLDLVVWPESSYNRLLSRRLDNVKARVLPDVDVPLLFNATTYEASQDHRSVKRFNSAILADADGAVLGRYDKVELLMFGETVPFAEVFPRLKKLSPNILTAGRDYVSLSLGETTLLPMVCYEDVLVGFVRRIWQRAGPADVLVNLTNDSWYDQQHEPLIHLVLASLRAIETRRALIRSTNTGISAIVDPVGRIVDRTETGVEATLVYDVPLITDGRSTFYMRWGPLLGWLALVVTLAGLFRLSRRIGLVAGAVAVALISAGCGTVEIPYDLGAVEARTTPTHPVQVAILPFVDARSDDDRPGDDDRFVYRGVEYTGTVLHDLRGRAVDRVTEVIARHLARRRVFAQVVLVSERSQAPNADLYLEGRIRRLRGYVESNPPSEKTGRPVHERRVLAEVLLDDIRLSTPDARVLMHVDAGWSRVDTVRASEPPDPWRIMSGALQVALARLCALIDGADLSGGFEVRPQVAMRADGSAVSGLSVPFAGLDSDDPYGWRFAADGRSTPDGWRGADDCRHAEFRWRQTGRFHRAVGPYQPRVRLWACPPDVRFRFDGRTPFPAEVLGEGPGGRYFVWTLGETNWPTASADLRRRLGIRRPPEGPVLQVGPATRPARAPSPSSAPRHHRPVSPPIEEK